MTEITEKLQLIYQNANDMLKFAESKNTILIAFNGAIIVGLVALIKDMPNYWVIGYLIFIILMNLISIFISLASLTALLFHREIEVKNSPNENLLFFNNIASFTPQVFLDTLVKRYSIPTLPTIYDLDTARQVIIISQIASRKFRLFNIAIAWTFAGLLTPISIIVYKLFLHPNSNTQKN